MFTEGHIIPYNIGDKWKVFHYDVCRKKTASNAVRYHKENAKQKSRGYETRGALVVPFMSRIQSIIESQPYMVAYRDRLTKLNNVAKRYEIVLQILMKAIQIRN